MGLECQTTGCREELMFRTKRVEITSIWRLIIYSAVKCYSSLNTKI
jgi:hypothetical protein